MHASNLAHGAHAQLSSILRILSHEPQLHVLNPCQHGHLHLQHKIHSWEISLSSAYFLLCRQQTLRHLDPPKFTFLYISQFTDFLLSFQASYILNTISVSVSYFSVISCCPRFFSFLHQHVAQHNPTLLSNKMASTHWNINCLQNSTTPVRLARVIRACDITCSIFIRTMRSGEQLQLLWLNNFPINANFLTGVTAVLFLCPT